MGKLSSVDLRTNWLNFRNRGSINFYLSCENKLCRNHLPSRQLPHSQCPSWVLSFGLSWVLSFGPSLVWLKKSKATKSYLLTTFCWWIATKTLNEYLNIELIVFHLLYRCFNKKRSIFSSSTKKVEKSSYCLRRVVQKKSKEIWPNFFSGEFTMFC